MAENKQFNGEPGLLNELRGNLSQIEEEGKRLIRSKKLEAVKESAASLTAEQERIARTIGLLYDTVYASPDKATPEILMELVSHHPKEPFKEEVTKNFAIALDIYKQKRAQVQKFLWDNKDPVLMFEKCFGFKPQGKVEVIPGPMTVCFRCFNDEDYMEARIHNITDKNNPSSKDKALQNVKNSVGVAFSSVQDKALPPGTVIAEKVGDNFEYRPTYRKREAKIEGKNKNTWQRFSYPSHIDSNLIYFKIPVIGEVEAHFRRDNTGEIEAIWLVESSTAATFATFDPFEKTEKFKLSVPGKKYSSEEWVEFEFADDSFAIYDHTKSGVGFETVEYTGTEQLIKNKDLSKQIRSHEEQHQFNKLFEPKDQSYFSLPFTEFKRLSHYAKNHPEENTAALIARKFAQIYRQVYIDGRARDEIIAYTRGGTEPTETAQFMATDPLYDYKKQGITLSNGEKTTWENYFADVIPRLTRELLEKGEVSVRLGNAVHAINFPFKKTWTQQDLQAAQAEVEKVLTIDYNNKLRRWTGLVNNMRAAGYKNRDIVPFLNMLPINRWHSAIRRLLKSKGQRPIDRTRQNIRRYWES